MSYLLYSRNHIERILQFNLFSRRLELFDIRIRTIVSYGRLGRLMISPPEIQDRVASEY